MDEAQSARERDTAQRLCLPARPRARADVILREIDDEALIFDPTTSDTHYLNRTAFAIWRACDGTRDGGEIAETLTRLFEVEEDVARDHVTRLFHQFHGAGLWVEVV